MASIYDVDQSELVDKAAEELKKINEIKPPEWAIFVKTGVHKEGPPVNEDWWYTRVASVLRLVYKLGPIGVSKLRVKYGGKKNRGVKPERFYKGSGNIIRKILQQLEKIGFIKQEEKGKHKGRVITPKGKSFLDKLATQLIKGVKTEKKEAKKEEKVELTAEELVKETKKEFEKKEEKKEKIPSAEQLAKETKNFVKGEKGPTAEELVKEANKSK
jgi:small subunit ribosomal protein S19e